MRLAELIKARRTEIGMSLCDFANNLQVPIPIAALLEDPEGAVSFAYPSRGIFP